MEQSYSFSSKPRAVQSSRKVKGGYRKSAEEEDDGSGYANIMFDRRVVRGSTYSKKDQSKLQEEQEKENKRQKMLERRRANMRQKNAAAAAEAPAPVSGHRHIDVQTDNYLEELTDKVPEVNEETQTEAFLDRPPEPLFMPAKIGVDTGTQVDVDELFDFDMEVEPILEVLVGKTLEHAMMEVMEEEEIAALREHQRKFEQERNIELAEVQRLEAEAKRRREEKERRVEQEKAALARETSVIGKVHARAFAKDTLNETTDSVFDKLMESGDLYDPIEKEIKTIFLPWIHETIDTSADLQQKARGLLDEIIANSFVRAKEKYQQAKKEHEEKLERERQEREELERKLAEEAKLAEEEETPADE